MLGRCSVTDRATCKQSAACSRCGGADAVGVPQPLEAAQQQRVVVLFPSLAAVLAFAVVVAAVSELA